MTFKVQFVASWNVLKNEGDPSIIRRINEFITGIDYSYQLEKTGELSIDHGLKRTGKPEKDPWVTSGRECLKVHVHHVVHHRIVLLIY